MLYPLSYEGINVNGLRMLARQRPVSTARVYRSSKQKEIAHGGDLFEK